MKGLRPAKIGADDLELCFIPATDSVIHGIYDAVVTVGAAAGISGQQSVLTVTRVAAGTNPIYGAIVDIDQICVENSSFSLERRHRPASVGMYVLVYRALPGRRFYIEPTTALAIADIGGTANLDTISDADTTTGLSKMTMSATVSTSGNGTKQFRILGFKEDPRLVIGTDVIDMLVEVANVDISEGDDAK